MIATNRLAESPPQTAITIHLHFPDRLTEAAMQFLATMSQRELGFSSQESGFSSSSCSSPNPESSILNPPRSPAATRPVPDASGDPSGPPAMGDGSLLDHSPTFAEAYRKHVIPIVSVENQKSMLGQHQTAIAKLEAWYKIEHRSGGPMLSDLEKSPGLLTDFYRHRLTLESVGTATNMLKSVASIWDHLAELGVMTKAAPKMRKARILRRGGFESEQHYPIPVTDSELLRILDAILSLADVLDYPRLGTVEPFEFWFNVIAICAVHGFRPADIWPIETHQGLGLLWSEVSLLPSPPIRNGHKLGADWEFGYLNLKMNKTGKRLCSPMSPHMSWLVQRMQGLDDTRVFPLKYDRARWYRAIDLILQTAGFEQVPIRHGSNADGTPKFLQKWPVTICGGSPQASLRKTASVNWRRHGGKGISSAMLGHSVRTGSANDVEAGPDEGSLITDQHYSGSEVFREILKAFPQLLAALPGPIRC